MTLKFSLVLECKAGLTEHPRAGSADTQVTETQAVSPEHVDTKQVNNWLCNACHCGDLMVSTLGSGLGSSHWGLEQFIVLCSWSRLITLST